MDIGRAIPSLILKQLQADENNNPSDLATSVNDQLSLLFRRGLTIECANVLWNAVIPHVAIPHLGQRPVSIPVGILRKSFLDGGMDLGPPLTLADEATPTAPVPKPGIDSAFLEEGINTHMSRDWVRVMSESIAQPFNSEAVVAALHKVNVCDSLRPEDKQEHQRILEKEVILWEAKLVCKVGTRSRLSYSEIFSNNSIDIIVDQYLQGFYNILSKKKLQDERYERVIETIFAAIAASPYKDISTASVFLQYPRSSGTLYFSVF